MQTSEQIILIISVILNIIGLICAGITHENLKGCRNRESLHCPSYSCETTTPKCGNAPFRCLTLDSSSSGCSGDNMVCMTYTSTDGKTYSTKPKTT